MWNLRVGVHEGSRCVLDVVQRRPRKYAGGIFPCVRDVDKMRSRAGNRQLLLTSNLLQT